MSTADAPGQAPNEATSKGSGAYLRALRFRWLTRFYDPLISRFLKDHKVKRLLLEQAGLDRADRVLELGCGTATLALMAKRAHAHLEVSGLDGDPEILALARAKAEAEGLEIELLEGLAQEVSLPAASFDRVLSSLFFHHLGRDDKLAVLRKAQEALVPWGELHVIDWGPPHSALMRFAFLAVRLLDGFALTADVVAGRLPRLMEKAGFVEVEQTHREATILGTLALYRAVKAAGPSSPQRD